MIQGDALFIETGTSRFEAGYETLQYPIQLNGIPSTHRPVVVVTPYRPAEVDGSHLEDDANINLHLDTTVTFNNTANKWEFNVKRSIGRNANSDTGAEQMSFMWKVVAVKHVQHVGPSVTIVDETF